MSSLAEKNLKLYLTATKQVKALLSPTINSIHPRTINYVKTVFKEILNTDLPEKDADDIINRYYLPSVYEQYHRTVTGLKSTVEAQTFKHNDIFVARFTGETNSIAIHRVKEGIDGHSYVDLCTEKYFFKVSSRNDIQHVYDRLSRRELFYTDVTYELLRHQTDDELMSAYRRKYLEELNTNSALYSDKVLAAIRPGTVDYLNRVFNKYLGYYPSTSFVIKLKDLHDYWPSAIEVATDRRYCSTSRWDFKTAFKNDEYLAIKTSKLFTADPVIIIIPFAHENCKKLLLDTPNTIFCNMCDNQICETVYKNIKRDIFSFTELRTFFTNLLEEPK